MSKVLVKILIILNINSHLLFFNSKNAEHLPVLFSQSLINSIRHV
jgi:hypothetical protein